MNKHLVHSIEWAVAVVAYGYLFYRLATYSHYDEAIAGLRAMGAWQWAALALCVALMPVNMALEAWRWQTLMGASEMSFGEAQRQVYYSKLAGLITPWRLGEYPARGVLMGEKADWGEVISMGVVGSATMTVAIVASGVIALGFSPQVISLTGGSYLYALAGIVIVLAAGLALMPKALKRRAEVNSTVVWRSVWQSELRLVCWCVQLTLVVFALNAMPASPTDMIALAPIYYLLVTVTPNVPIVEAGVRGAWAILLFGTLNAALAGVLLWAINTLLPCVGWLFFKKNAK